MAKRMIGVGCCLLWIAANLWAQPGGKASRPPTAAGSPGESLAKVERQLAAGEFGPALDTALTTRDAGQRAMLLERIVDAQVESGDYLSASATARNLPAGPSRSTAQGQVLRERSLAGGGVQADFQPLIDLLTATVSPDSWDTVGGEGNVTQFDQGVRVDPNGLLRRTLKEETSGRLAALGVKARTADLHDDMAKASDLRMVSLTRLERAVAERLASGQPILETMRRLGGLTRAKYVFIDPARHELILAGQAKAWEYDSTGRPIGRESHRPLMDLDDLVTVLRTFAPGGEGVFGCSINPREAAMKDVRDFVAASNAAGPLAPGRIKPWVNELQKRLGMQDVVVYGVPANTRVAHVLVEADYRMKLIGVGKLDGGPHIPSYFDLLKVSAGDRAQPLEALRWWMTMKYDAVLHSPDRMAFEIDGSSVLVQSENQFVTSQGRQIATGKSEPTNRLFAENFTRHYAELAQRDLVFADLQNVFDLALVAALLQHEKLTDRIGWQLGCFAADGAYRPANVPAPQVVESVVNHRLYNGRDIVVQAAGGVRGDVLTVVRDQKKRRPSDQVAAKSLQGLSATAPTGRWWWDASR
jgi:hypothetical protein